MNKIKIAIIGTGNIGTDLLVKINKSEFATCTLFAGRNPNSKGMNIAKSLNVPISDKGFLAIVDNPNVCDIVIDCTSAVYHAEHWEKLKNLNKLVIDMTPAKIGDFYIPALNGMIADNLSRKIFYNLNKSLNINMVTCGGQSIIPIAYALSSIHSDIEYLEVASNIASLSAGPATRYNLDEYLETTQKALSQFTGVKKTKAILILNPATPCIDMQTTIYAKIKNPNMPAITNAVNNIIAEIKKYVPGYQVIVPPTILNNNVMVTIKVLGAGDYLAAYAGNLDVINCAAMKLIEQYMKEVNV